MENLKRGGGRPPDGTAHNNVYALRLESRRTVTLEIDELARILARITALEQRQRRIEADTETVKTCCPVARNIFRQPAD
jgi:hypothetical protein